MSKKKRYIILSLVLLLICCNIALAVARSGFADSYGNSGFKTIDVRAQKLANYYLHTWQDDSLRTKTIATLHSQNPEWDFMFRTYSVLAFANLALHNPDKQGEYLKAIDLIIDDTRANIDKRGFKYYLMSYGQNDNWKVKPGASLFIDGEVALTLAVRCLVENKPDYAAELARMSETIISRMQAQPQLCTESYPDECWMFCNTIALAAVRISDKLNSTDRSDFLAKWVANVKTNLCDNQSGLVRSAFRLDGKPVDSASGPEGSSIWMACHMLEMIDAEFARTQYEKATKAFLGSVLGFGYSREWPAGTPGKADIDSGEVVPFLNASPSASGLAILCTASFKDTKNYNSLTASLNTFGAPVEKDDYLYYKQSNALGDVVVLYGLTAGPVWEKAKK